MSGQIFYIMICEETAKNYCCEDLSLIENYDKAIDDTTQTWHCHHRGEILPCGRFSRDDLKKFGLYFYRPASELIFIKKFNHLSLHRKGVPLSQHNKAGIGNSLSKKILQHTKSGEFIREWPSMAAIYRELGIRQGNIFSCCRGKRNYAGGFIWRYA